jgi:hypothetical protein
MAFGGHLVRHLAVAGCWSAVGCGPTELCEQLEPVATATAFVLAEPDAGPFRPNDGEIPCGNDRARLQPFGAEQAFEVDTVEGCGFATATQPSLQALTTDDELQMRIFYFSQTTFPAAEAEVAMAIGEDVVFAEQVAIPAVSGLLPSDRQRRRVAAPAAVGTPVYFHIGNHGDNSWNFLELSVVRQVVCGQ